MICFTNIVSDSYSVYTGLKPITNTYFPISTGIQWFGLCFIVVTPPQPKCVAKLTLKI